MIALLLLWAELPSTAVAGAKLTLEYEAKGTFFEGPTWDPKGGHLYFTAFKGKDTSILRLDGRGKASVWLTKTEGVNGTFLSGGGRLLGAQAFGHRVMRYDFGPAGPAATKVLLHDPTLNQPNDLCEGPDGTIYFTDPDFAARKKSAVYMLRGERAVKVITDMPLPNGLKLSPDGRRLYVGDSHEKRWKVYPVLADGTVGPGRVFFDPDTKDRRDPDGMAVDADGNLYLTGRGGVWAVNPEGRALGLIPVKEFASNVTFGGAEGRTLFVTCQDRLYSVPMTVRGALFGR